MARPRSTDELDVAPGCRIPVSEIAWRFATSGGPGGQHANRSATQAEAVFDVWASESLGDWHKQRIAAALGPVVNVVASDTRSQSRNREIALDRLRDRLAEVFEEPKPRRPTRPSRAARDRRVSGKRHRGEKKRLRGRVRPDDD